MSSTIIIIGAGLAGLAAARRLNRAGREVLIIDADSRAGGRLKTDVLEGFRLDRGFQVYFSAYPFAGPELDFSRLNMKKFVPGAIVWDGKKLNEINGEDEIAMLFRSYLGFNDKFRLMTYSNELKSKSIEEIWAQEDIPAETLLQRVGFSTQCIDRFFRPFFGGIFLDRSLSVSSQMFEYVMKMLAMGDTCVPALGMEEIPKQIAADLPASAFRFNTRVSQVIVENGVAKGVKLESGEVIGGEWVVVATEASTAADLTGLPVPKASLSSTCIWYDAAESPTEEALIVLNGPGHGKVNHVACMTKVSKDYAPAGRHLVCATILGDSPLDDIHTAESAKFEVARWLPGADKWRPLRVDRISFAQMQQLPGFRNGLPGTLPGVENLCFAGEFTQYSSIDGACRSAQLCAAHILKSRSAAAV